MKRLDSMYDVKLHDPYMDKSIYPDPTVCPECGLIYHNKRWTRDGNLLESLKAKGKEIHKKQCPACRKIKDRYPLGILELRGSLVNDPEKKELILNTIRNESNFEERRNPLARIMEVKEENNAIYIFTTTESLARRLGRVVNKAFKGELTLMFSEDNKFIRVLWEGNEHGGP